MLPGPTELALILVIVLILFGAGRLPQVFEAFGEGLKKFRDAQRADDDLEDVSPAPSAARKEIPSAHDVADAEEVAKTPSKGSSAQGG